MNRNEDKGFGERAKEKAEGAFETVKEKAQDLKDRVTGERDLGDRARDQAQDFGRQADNLKQNAGKNIFLL